MTDFQRTLQGLINVSGKSLSEIAETAGVDRSYLLRLVRGDKVNPSPETLVKVWIGICMDGRLVKSNPMFIHGLAELMLAAGLSQYANAKRAE
jgi:DNA-binding phage protein